MLEYDISPELFSSLCEFPTASPMHELAYYITPVSWMVLLLLLRDKRLFKVHGYGDELYELLVEMHGSSTRLRILDSLHLLKNRSQLARELGLHWESIDHHVSILLRHGLIEFTIMGNSSYPMATDRVEG